MRPSGPSPSGPSRSAEAFVAVLLPPACREEVLGDLHERYRSPGQYALDVLTTVPLVILSRILRTVDAELLLIQAFLVYLAFLGVAWWQFGSLVRTPWELLKHAIPAVMFLLGLLLADVYTGSGKGFMARMLRGPLVGVGTALLSQGFLQAVAASLSLPGWVLLYGCGLSLLLASTARLLFASETGVRGGAYAHRRFLTRARGTAGNPVHLVRVLQAVAVLLTCLILGTWIPDHRALARPRLGVALLLIILAFAYRSWKRG
jgi:hypothetical protein